ncbi:IS3 family transposase [Xenorhabdus budapestensis]|uniref:IS3 family transposase n=1 Tax=Xenorhabdus budapestensis TaxID=290110 RepID=UPI003A842321
MKLKLTKRQYSAEFKLEAVQQVVLHQQRVVDVAHALGINNSTLGKWVHQYKAEIQGITPVGKAMTPEQRQIQALEKQVKRLEMEKEIPKAGGRVDERDAQWRYALSTRLSPRCPVTELCQMLQVSRSAYYDWRQRPVDTERLQLRIRVRELYNQSRGAIGRRTLSHLLTNEGWPVGLMQECGLQSRQPGGHRYHQVGEASLVSPNLLRQHFAPACPNSQWCGDITSVRIKAGWSYLAVVTDLFSRRVVGMAIASSPDAERVCRALNNALETRHIEGRLVFHSDQGSQYRSKKFRRLLWQNKIIQSMSRKGNCYDNSPMERVFRSLKSEWSPPEGYRDIHEAMRDITDYFGRYYNDIRPHRFNGGISPAEYERLWEEARNVSETS